MEDVLFNGLAAFVKALSKVSVNELATLAGLTEITTLGRAQLERNLVNRIDDLVHRYFPCCQTKLN